MNGMKHTITHEDVFDTREHVEAMRVKLDEIHKFYEENLKRPPQSQGSPHPPSYPSFDAGSFVLYEEQGNYSEAEAGLCPHARLEDLWADDPKFQTDLPRRNIFKCGCSSTADSHNLQYTLLPFSVFVQVIGRYGGMRWQVYVRSLTSNTPISLILGEIDPRELSKIEAWIDQAALHSVENHLSNGLQTSFVQEHKDTISVLRMKTNSIKYTAKLLNVVFRTTNGAFIVDRFSSIQVLQYGTTWHPDCPAEPVPAQLFPQAHVNIVLTCLPDDSQAQKCFTVRVNQDTNVSVTGKPRYVEVDDAICFQEIIKAGSQGSSPSDPVECSKITLEFSDSADAQEFLADLKDAKKRLRMQYLRQVRWEDKLIGQLDLPGELIIRNLVLQDVQLKIILDRVTGVFRMALVRRDHSAGVTFEVPPNFLQDLEAGKESGYENHPAWFVNISKDRVNIIKQESGMDPLVAPSKAFQDYLGTT
ncbi:hypothetical protein FJTKL_12871 [Diaporthe vaccinii]|uniref:Uncharacterized protein n=1 Tax=Diaporthe vaccinii TaxID=105482 RepID=A0ABR4F9U5_9PEZI